MVICPDCGKDVKDAKFCSNDIPRKPTLAAPTERLYMSRQKQQQNFTM